MVEFHRSVALVGTLLALLGVTGGGCDQLPGPSEAGEPPLVTSLLVRPDSVHASDLPPEQIQDSLAQVVLELEATVRDPEGTIARVQFVLEPAANPRGAASGTLRPRGDHRYGRRFSIQIPADRRERYTVRVFAVDDDSLASNQSLGQFQFVPSP